MTKLDDTKLPWLALVVADYQRDTRHLSLSARGAWTDILCAMHVAQIRGRVRFNRVKLARFLGATVDQADAILEELRDPNNSTGSPVVDYADGTDGHFELVSRRMVRDEQRRTTNRANGARGGNPTLKAVRLTDSDNRLPNPPVNRGVNPKSQSQSQTGEVSPDPSSAAGAAGDPKPAKRKVSERKLTDDQNAVRLAFIEWWCQRAFPSAMQGVEYDFDLEGARNGSAVSKLLGAVRYDFDEAKAIAWAYLKLDDAYIANRARPLYDILNNLTRCRTIAKGYRAAQQNGSRHGNRNANRDANGARAGEFTESGGVLARLAERGTGTPGDADVVERRTAG